jgi:hypothetical protein
LTSLPNQAAYALVVDPRPAAGAPVGFLYVGTQVGVYVSVNGGASWSALGQALPSAPVVDLQFNPSLNELAAAVQGRGVFMLSTQVSGPIVTASTPTVPQNTPLSTIDVTFNEPVDPRSFTTAANDVARQSVTGPLATTGEAFANRVSQLYTTYLRRSPSAAEANSLATVMFNNQLSDPVLVADLAGSDEYFNNASLGQGSNSTWLAQVYQDLFHRAETANDPTATQLAFLSATPGTSQATLQRIAVVEAMVGVGVAGVTSAQAASLTDEYERNLVAGLYNQFLAGNYPSPAPANNTTLNNWVTLLDRGKPTWPASPPPCWPRLRLTSTAASSSASRPGKASWRRRTRRPRRWPWPT